MIVSDILIIGTGIAGATTAIKLAEKHPSTTITILSKDKPSVTNTSWAQGGIAAVWNKTRDEYQKHIADTLDAGDGLCTEDIVRIVIEEGPERVQEIIDWGTRFDKDDTGLYNLGMEGGHSEYRILHYKDQTGREIQRALLEKLRSYPNITLIENVYAIDLITQHHLGYNITRVTPDIKCYGAYVLEKVEDSAIERYLAKVTILATGGAGQVYRNTTNPHVATGDGIAMTYRAKGLVENMEFVQFHPTALYQLDGQKPDFLISEAVRGFGAILKTTEGKDFMQLYDKRLSLAPRDIVARAIDNEMKKTGDDYVFLDCRHLDQEGFLAHFPTIYEKCTSLGIDPFTDFIPVVPACHYICGGVRVDAHGQSSITNLYACGEVSCTGLHGANRLASNSLLEGLVFAHRIAENIGSKLETVEIQYDIPRWSAIGTTDPKEMVLITQSMRELKEIMSSYVGIVRTDVRLKRAIDRLRLLHIETEELYQTTTISPQLCQLRNLITIAYLITKSAFMRKESRGLHFNTDYPLPKPFVDRTIV